MMNINKTKLIMLWTVGLFTACTKDAMIPTGESNKIELSSPAVSVASQTGANLSATLSAKGADRVQDKGICWGTSINPTTSNATKSSGPAIGNFSAALTSLNPGTTYYARSYFQTPVETVYSANTAFKTLDYQLATVSTNTVGSITLTTAIASGTVSLAGGGTVSQRGFCWNTSSLPTISNTRTISGSGLGAFTDNITSLSPGTTYYLRAYAINQAGTAYGAQITFTTQNINLATVGSVSISSVAKNSATLIASVSADGGGAVSSKGICYSSTTSLPSLTNSSLVNNGPGIGSVGGSISGLTSAVTYYVRAYAVNAAGVSYGPVSAFRTL